MRGTADRMEALRRFAAGEASGRVVEIGCGTGLNFDVYDWRRIDHLDACEPDPFMLKRARQRLERLPAGVQEKVTLHEVPAEALPFEDATYDCAVSTLVLCTVADPLASTRELRRVLKPGGRLRLVEHVRGSGVLATFQAAIQPVWGWTAAGCHLNRNTELAVAAGGLRLQVQERFSLGPFLPAIRGIAVRDP
ncbi:MAG: class I SAM-dependent methyltransferase [Dehalococcoidia bacterium]